MSVNPDWALTSYVQRPSVFSNQRLFTGEVHSCECFCECSQIAVIVNSIPNPTAELWLLIDGTVIAAGYVIDTSTVFDVPYIIDDTGAIVGSGDTLLVYNAAETANWLSGTSGDHPYAGTGSAGDLIFSAHVSLTGSEIVFAATEWEPFEGGLPSDYEEVYGQGVCLDRYGPAEGFLID